MKILLVSPLGTPINPETKYGGIERLVWDYANELRRDHEVTVMGHADSIFPEDVTLLGTRSKDPDVFVMAEVRQYQSWAYVLRDFNVIHDFSHQQFASRYTPALKSLNPFWHAPAIAQYPKSPYNIIALSRWAEREFKRVYKQDARYQQSIVVDPEIYCKGGKRGDRFLTLGIMSENKGNLEAIKLCQNVGVPLDVAGAPADKDYEDNLKVMCDGEQVRFLGEVTHEQKIELMQTCRALIYITPDAYSEVTSHKLQEAMFCGAPIITTPGGAFPEIVTDGVNGFLCASENEFIEAVKNVDKLEPDELYEEVAQTYSIRNVVADYVKLYQEVADGLRW